MSESRSGEKVGGLVEVLGRLVSRIARCGGTEKWEEHLYNTVALSLSSWCRMREGRLKRWLEASVAMDD